MRQTSLLAYNSIKKELSPRQQSVFAAIRQLGVCNDKQIADYLGWPINTVTPRRGELLKQDKIEAAYVKKDFTGRPSTYWRQIAESEFGDVE